MGPTNFRMLRAALSVLVATSYSSQLAAQNDVVCSEIMAVIAHARTDFRELKGESLRPLVRGDARYRAVRALPGAGDCQIAVDRDKAEFECAWYIGDAKELEKQYRAFADAIKICLSEYSTHDDEERPSTTGDRISPATVRIAISDKLSVILHKWSYTTTSTRTRIQLRIRESKG
jgi:hypothetical protein